MNGPKVSLITLMAIVGFVAIDLSLGGDLFAEMPLLLDGVALGAVAVEVGLIVLVISRGRVRAFWAGFVIGAGLATASYLWSMKYGRPMYFGCANGRLFCKWWAYRPSSSWDGLANLWHSYGVNATNGLERTEYLSRVLIGRFDSRPKVMVVSALILFLPQLVIAVAGGLLALVLAWMAGVWLRRRSTAARSETTGELRSSTHADLTKDSAALPIGKKRDA